ncbi:MAG TPA: hypothetical protein VMK32_03820, partial [Burkholderiaceae bacterium]|nr:hypothetical protein [Burkholderiaceae bacterium]
MPRQLDIFADGRDVGLRNEIADAVIRGDAPAARVAADALRAEFDGDAALAPAALLIEHIDAQRRPQALPDADELRRLRRELER